MARWLVTQGDRQFAAQDLEELKRLASAGQIGRGDMIQPPGASDWLYASELPELNGLLKASARHDDDDVAPRRTIPAAIVAAVLLAISAGGGYAMYHYAQQIQGSDLDLLNELALTEMLVTAEGGATIRQSPEDGAGAAGNAPKNAEVQLMAKRGPWYRIRTEAGAEGWVKVDEVVPAYFFADADTRQDYDPLYNPDKYVYIKNAGWLQLPDQRKRNTTNFTFLLQNKSKFDMEGIVLLAIIKDKAGKVIEKKEVPIEGVLKRFDGTMVGTLQPDPKDKEGVPRTMTQHSFDELAKSDPDLNLRWSDGVEVVMESKGFTDANIELLEVRAIPKKLD
jgi:hypothetical protein